MTLDLILFYFSEYFVYAVIMGVISALAIFAIKRYGEVQDTRPFVGVVVAAYFIFFTGIGGLIKPYFTSSAQYSYLYDEGFGGVAHGTGSFVNHTDVMTNAHVAEHCSERLEIKTKHGTYQGRVIAVLKRGEGDLAFIRTNAIESKFILLSAKKPQIGDIVLFPNYTANPTIFDKVKGKITKIGEGEDGLEFLAPKGRQGNSGSPIYNEKGYVVGIVHSEYFSLQPIMIGTDLETIRNFAAQNGIAIFYSKNQEIDLTKQEDFYDNFAVNIICAANKRKK